MSLTPQDVEKIANLARLELTPAEKVQYLEQLSAILDYAEMLNELDLDDIVPTAHAISAASARSFRLVALWVYRSRRCRPYR